jgi:invasion protein IalB
MVRLFTIVSLFCLAGVCAVTSVAAQTPPNWITNCGNEPQTGLSVCKVEHTILLAKTGQQLLKITVRKEAGAPLPAVMIHVPFGLYMPDGIQVRIDEQEALQLEIQTCNEDGCYAGSAVSEEMLASMIGGKTFSVTFRNLEKKEMTVPVPLADFGPAYAKVR